MRLDRLRDLFVDPMRQFHAGRLIGQKNPTLGDDTDNIFVSLDIHRRAR